MAGREIVATASAVAKTAKVIIARRVVPYASGVLSARMTCLSRTPRSGLAGKAWHRNRLLADLSDVPAMSIDELMAQYAKLSPVNARTDAMFWELVDARSALRKFIVAAACREDRLIEVSQRLLTVELPTRSGHRDISGDEPSTVTNR
jgi:hypothetical protein